MIDKDSLSARLDKLRKYVSYLKLNQDITLDELKDNYMLHGAICRYFQLAIECVTDIAELLISSSGLRKPTSAREAIEILSDKQIIPEKFAKKFASVAGFRNILVHDYLEIDLDRVIKHLKHDLKDFAFYAKCIATYITSLES